MDHSVYRAGYGQFARFLESLTTPFSESGDHAKIGLSRDLALMFGHRQCGTFAYFELDEYCCWHDCQLAEDLLHRNLEDEQKDWPLSKYWRKRADIFHLTELRDIVKGVIAIIRPRLKASDVRLVYVIDNPDTGTQKD